MATYWKRNTNPTNNNWNQADNWSTVSSSSSTNAGTFPVAGDTANLDSGSSSFTVNITSACATLNMTGYAATLTGSTFAITITNGLTIGGAFAGWSTGAMNVSAGGITLSSTATGTAFPILIVITTGQTLTSNGYTWPGQLKQSGAQIFILAGGYDWINGGLASLGTTITTWKNTTAERMILNGGLTLFGNLANSATPLTFVLRGGMVTGAFSIANPIIIDSSAGNIIFASATIFASTFDMTGYASGGGTLAFGTSGPSVTGLATLEGAMSSSGAGTLNCVGGVTLNTDITGTPPTLALNATQNYYSGGHTYNGTILVNLISATITLNNDLKATTISLAYRSIIFAGAYNFYVANLWASPNISSGTNMTFPAGQNVTVSNSLYLSGLKSTFLSFISSTSTPWHLIYQGTPANCMCSMMTFTNVDASGSAQSIDNWYGGTLTNTTNIINRTSADIGGSVGWLAGE